MLHVERGAATHELSVPPALSVCQAATGSRRTTVERRTSRARSARIGPCGVRGAGWVVSQFDSALGFRPGRFRG